ncbi:trans-aconitate 2-methyltransferase [Mycobacterium sp. CBMA293]|uniref:trans-aconitate 2-methyltransferase n=2 Tax=Mycolicibacterium TaxID=1866885 RepID=UPI00132BDDF1|nr:MULTISPECIES: trans-aconitate 2-methyltransferase [unclassified Mycolicibacterium]MUL47924.1 trans-aconitate 2-methyltransferase [Mycolicibacterium sp. CBMA 360]MUL94596.1 trans-aconitate 2-methyltransferase [Mycolicibacterium sp. CBMA 230]MUL59228.1 trans-aconitate 2-methyltransferase [Mycolicibacterium sp. CBMA 335]MUL70953.1 trans-aconitate 2-methyltransferase [Mycolicibacterium sp. CBMA 311]MUM09226.1 trans-aconitate methyltransferase [Mycolicibacterium sp. CBMA 213]
MWNPDTYLAFADHRGRPFYDLLARVGAQAPRRVADVGCGPGNLTATLPQRWPDAVIEAVDSSPEMVAAARARGVDAHVANAAEWSPARDTDVLVSNAVLQWIPNHNELLQRWVAQLPKGAWLAFQVPGNFDSPSHQAVREVARRPGFADALADIRFREADVVEDPAGYAALLTAAGCTVDAWETTYLHQLTGATPVLDWISGTALTDVRSRLTDDAWEQYRREIIPLLAQAYPPQPDGTTFFPFRRIFVVAQV